MMLALNFTIVTGFGCVQVKIITLVQKEEQDEADHVDGKGVSHNYRLLVRHMPWSGWKNRIMGIFCAGR